MKYDKKKDALIAKPSPAKQVPCSAAAEAAETSYHHQKASQKVVETAILRAKQTQVDVRARALAHHHLAERFSRFNKLLLSFAALLAVITACFGVLSFKRESDAKAEYEKFNEHHDNSTLMASIATLNPLISLLITVLSILKIILILISAHCNFGGLAAAHRGTKQSLKRFNTRLDHYIQSLQLGMCDAPEGKEKKKRGSKVDVVHIREKFAHLKEDLCTLDDEAPALHGAWTGWTILPWWMSCRFTRCISEIKGENDELISPFDLRRRGMMVHFYELQCGRLEACKSKVVDEPKSAGKLVLPSNFGEEVVGRSKLTGGKPLTASGTSGTKTGSSDHAFSIDAALEARKRWQKVDFWKEERKLRVQQEHPPYDFVAVRDIEAQGGHLDEDGKEKLGPPSVIEFASPENSPGNSMNESSIGHGSFGGDMSPSNV